MSGFWLVFWLALVMKIPIGMLLYLVWWAIKDPPEQDVDDGEGGSRRDGPHPRLTPPQPPRRGPHADPAPQAPARVRATSRSRTPV